MLHSVLKKIPLNENEDLEKLMADRQYFKKNYILVETSCIDFCCDRRSRRELCICNKSLYQIRPFFHELVLATQSFYELIIILKLPKIEIE